MVWLCCLAVWLVVAASGYVFGPPHFGLAGAGLAFLLVWASAIDCQRHILPNALTIPIIISGLAAGAWTGQLYERLIGAILGYMVLAGFGWLYERRSGRIGLGLGDAKLFAGAGAWLGWTCLPIVMLIASASALAVVGASCLLRRDAQWRVRPIAFGPFISAGLWAVWLLGPIWF